MRIKDYFTPKSLVYTGAHDNVKTTIKHYFYDNELRVTDTFKKNGEKSYIQVIGLSDVNVIEGLREIYPIDSLTLEDVFNVHQRVKIEDKGDYIFSVFHIVYIKDNEAFEDYLSLLMFENTLISFHEKEPLYLDALYPLLENYKEIKEKGVDYLYYHILDIITDHHLDVADESMRFLDEFEADILDSKRVNQEDFYQIRKSLLRIKGITSPVHPQLEKALMNQKLFKKDSEAYFEDLKDHFKRLDDNIQEQRELTRHLLDLHMNNQSNQMNQIMKTLTLFSAIFIPLSFLTGFFGMNFKYFDALEYKHSLMIFILLCVLLTLGMLYFFKILKYFK